MNMIDLMKVGAGIVLVGSVCESGMCADYKGAQLVRGLYDLTLEDNMADLTLDKIKADGGNWDSCTLGNGVDSVAKAIYNAGGWANGAVSFESLTNEAKILVYGIAKATKGDEANTDNDGWKFFAHMFKSGGLAADDAGIASVLNAWGDFARREALDWAQYQALQGIDKQKIDEQVLDYSRSAWRCCGMDEDSMKDYIEALDELIENDACNADVDDQNFDLMIKNVVANGRRLSAAQTAGGKAIWDAGQKKFKAAALAEWKTKTTGDQRQKAIAEDFIKHMGNQVIDKTVKSGSEAAVCFESSKVKIAASSGGKKVQALQDELNRTKGELTTTEKRLTDYTKRMKKIQTDAKPYCKINIVTGQVTPLK